MGFIGHEFAVKPPSLKMPIGEVSAVNFIVGLFANRFRNGRLI